MANDDAFDLPERVDASDSAAESSGAADSGDSLHSGDSPPSGIAERVDSRVVRGRELARLMRRQAYQRAKEMRAKDPKHLAMKQLAKERRRAAGKAVREKRKAEQAVERAVEKKESAALRAGERAERDQRLLKELLTRGAAPAKKTEASASEDKETEEHTPPLLRVRSPRSDYDVN
jgi:hypothetical protein